MAKQSQAAAVFTSAVIPAPDDGSNPAMLYGYGRGGWWGVLLVPAATLHFYIAFRLTHPPRERPPS